MSKRKLTRQQSWRIERVQKERALRAERREALLEEKILHNELGPEQEGLVIAHYGVQIDVEAVKEKDHKYRCYMRANLPSLVTGDRVIWCDSDNNTGVVVARLPRKSELCRPDLRGNFKPIAANVDQIFIVVAPVPKLYCNLIDRYLVAAEAVGIEPVILLNKIDLLNKESKTKIDTTMEFYASLGYRIVKTSVKNALNFEELKQALNDRASVFVGQSGVGRGPVRHVGYYQTNKKVLAIYSIYSVYCNLEHQKNVFLTGRRSLDGLWHMEAQQVLQGFREFVRFIGQCKFSNCKHHNEPGCALLFALKQGEISEKRLLSYRAIIDSI